MFFSEKKSGFTLAEVLITIGLIGCIASLTIPSLAYNYRAKVLEEQFRSTYSDIKQVGAMIAKDGVDLGDYAYGIVYGGGGTNKWAEIFMSYLTGGGAYDETANSTTDISSKLRAIYKEARAPEGPFYFYPKNRAGMVCDNGGIWTDSKGRLWMFNGENSMICVDINGTAPPNRLNIDIFAFVPMSAREVAVWVYDDPDNVNNYTSQFVSCNLDEITRKGTSNKRGKDVSYIKGNGAALDSCPYNAPLENIAGGDTDARGKAVDPAKNSYWKDYIRYK